MSPEISERSFEEAIECGLLQDGPDACAGNGSGFREAPRPYGDGSPGGYRRRHAEDYERKVTTNLMRQETYSAGRLPLMLSPMSFLYRA